MATKRQLWEDLAPDDIDGRHYVVVSITPELPQDRMVKSQLAQAYRTPGVDGKPLMDDRTILETILEADHPDLIASRVNQQMLPAQSQEIGKLIMAAAEYDWKEENPETVKKAEEILNPDKLPPVSGAQAQALMEIIKMIMSGGADPALLMSMMQQADAGGVPTADGGMVPAGPMPGAIPSQMQMLPEEALPDPATLPASQERRGRPAN